MHSCHRLEGLQQVEKAAFPGVYLQLNSKIGIVFLFLNVWINKVCEVVEQALEVTMLHCALSLLYKANLSFRE